MRIVDDPEETAAEQAFARGEQLSLVSLYFERGELDRAAAIARMALVMEPCRDAAQVEAILEKCSAPPDDWRVVLDTFAEHPSFERWREVMQFVPDELRYQRHRNGIRYLKKRGVAADLLFLCACESGLTPEAMELVEEGLVSVETVMLRADEAGAARGSYVGLAAEAAFLGGDLLTTIRLLREAVSLENEWIMAFPHIHFVRERASPDELDALDRAGIPQE